MTPARAFVVLGLAGGVALGILTPPGAAPDETRHLSRVYAISEGVLRVPGEAPPPVTIPRSIPALHRAVNGSAWPRPPPRRTPAELAALLRQPLDPGRRVGVASAGTYPPIVYTPHVVGVALGRWLGLSPAALVYLGRLASLAAWIPLTAFALHLAPARRWTLATLSLAPMAVAGAASVSADPMTASAALLFTAVALRSICASGTIARGELAGLLGAALLLGLVKPAYWALAPVALAIPAARTGGRARQLALAACVAATIAVPSLAWLAWAQTSLPLPPSPGADPAAQLRVVLGDPLGFLAAIGRSLAAFGPSYWTTFVGELGLLIVKLPAWAYALYGLALIAVVALDGPLPAALTAGRRAWLAAAFVATVVVVFAMAYLGWNQVGDRLVRGVQGRYWAPAMPALAFALPATPRALPTRLRTPLCAVLAALLAAAAVAVARVYYRT